MKDDTLKPAKDLWAILSSVSTSSYHANHMNWILSKGLSIFGVLCNAF